MQALVYQLEGFLPEENYEKKKWTDQHHHCILTTGGVT